jgi:hypothetical protein
MGDKVLSKDKYCKNIISLNPLLNCLNSIKIQLEYKTFGIEPLLNGILIVCTPTEEEEIMLNKSSIDIILYVYNNILYSIDMLLTINDDKLINALNDACYDIYKDSFTMINNTTHDKELKIFEIKLMKHLKMFLKSHPAQIIFLCFARCVFTKRQFQAPVRKTAEEAVKDALGFTNLWQEYLEIWNIRSVLILK